MNRPNALDHSCLPFNANRDFKQDSRLIVSTEGMYDSSEDGRQIMDAMAALLCVKAGHRDPWVTAALLRQIDRLDDAPGLNLPHPATFKLSSRIAETGTCHDV